MDGPEPREAIAASTPEASPQRRAISAPFVPYIHGIAHSSAADPTSSEDVTKKVRRPASTALRLRSLTFMERDWSCRCLISAEMPPRSACHRQQFQGRRTTAAIDAHLRTGRRERANAASVQKHPPETRGASPASGQGWRRRLVSGS